MNAPFPKASGRPVELQPHEFTHEQVLQLIAEGHVPQRVQLLDGVIYDMADDGERHIGYAMLLAKEIIVALAAKSYFVGVQTTLYLAPRNAPSPDIYILAGAGSPKGGPVPPERILLVIEVADTSLKDDLNDKAFRYARHGVREYWVVDVNAREIVVHQNPADGAYPPPVRVNAQTALSPHLIPDLSLRLADLAVDD